jgi:hypothetical protein
LAQTHLDSRTTATWIGSEAAAQKARHVLNDIDCNETSTEGAKESALIL